MRTLPGEAAERDGSSRSLVAPVAQLMFGHLDARIEIRQQVVANQHGIGSGAFDLNFDGIMMTRMVISAWKPMGFSLASLAVLTDMCCLSSLPRVSGSKHHL
jgi:hypothetical protein